MRAHTLFAIMIIAGFFALIGGAGYGLWQYADIPVWGKLAASGGVAMFIGFMLADIW